MKFIIKVLKRFKTLLATCFTTQGIYFMTDFLLDVVYLVLDSIKTQILRKLFSSECP